MGEVSREEGKCLDILLSEEKPDGEGSRIESFPHFYLEVKIHGHEDKTRTYRLVGKNPRVVARAIQVSLAGMCFSEPVREVFFHNNRSEPETPLPKELYQEVLSYLSGTHADTLPGEYQISIQDKVPVIRGI